MCYQQVRPALPNQLLRSLRFNIMLLPFVLYLTSSSLASGLECGSPGDSFPHDAECGSYYICDHRNQPLMVNCPEGQLYDKTRRKCDASGNVQCTTGPEEHAALPGNHELQSFHEFILGAEDLRKVMQKLGKPDSDNPEGESTNKEAVEVQNSEYGHERQTDENEKDAKPEGIETGFQTKDGTNHEDDTDQIPRSTEIVEIHGDKNNKESVSKEEIDDKPVNESEKEIDDKSYRYSGQPEQIGDVFSSGQFISSSYYYGLVPLSKGEDGQPASPNYGYTLGNEEHETVENEGEINEGAEQHDLDGKGDTNGERVGNGKVEDRDSGQLKSEVEDKQGDEVDESQHKQVDKNGEEDIIVGITDAKNEQLEESGKEKEGDELKNEGQPFNPEREEYDTNSGSGVSGDKHDNTDIMLPLPGDTLAYNSVDSNDQAVGPNPMNAAQDDGHDDAVDTQLVQNVADDSTTPTNTILLKTITNYTHLENSDL